MYRLFLPFIMLLVGISSPRAEPFRRLRATGSIDFRRGVATSTGVGPRKRAGRGDPALSSARLNLKALVYPHPVDDESTLGDLAAFHPDLGAALELQLGEAEEVGRRALPPDLEEVTVELELGKLVAVLLPYLGQASRSGIPAATRSEDLPTRVLLRLPPDLARDHVPSLLPSIRSLSGDDVFPAGGRWIRRAYETLPVSYLAEPPLVGTQDWEIPVVSTGGLAGATLFLRDPDAERLHRLLRGEDPPTVVIVEEESGDPVEESREGLSPSLPVGKAPDPGRWKVPVAEGDATSLAAPVPAPPPALRAESVEAVIQEATAPLRAPATPPAPPLEASDGLAPSREPATRDALLPPDAGPELPPPARPRTSPTDPPTLPPPPSSMPSEPPASRPLVAPAVRPDPTVRPDPGVQADPGSEAADAPRRGIEELLLEFRRRARAREQARPRGGERPLLPPGTPLPVPSPSPAPAASPPHSSTGRMPLEALQAIPSEQEEPLDALLYQGRGPDAPRSPPTAALPPPAFPTASPRAVPPIQGGNSRDEGAGEIPPDLVEPPSIRWQYFQEEDEEAGELPR